MKHVSPRLYYLFLACLLLGMLFGAPSGNAQNFYNTCHDNLRDDVSAVGLPDKVCQNECTDLAASSCIADVMTDDFEGQNYNANLWSGNTTGQTGTLCGASGGSKALLMDGAGLRIAETKSLNTVCARKISFSLTYGTSAVPGNCEDAELPDENVSLEFFNPATGKWTKIDVYDNGGSFPSVGPYDSWTTVCINLPAAARAQGVRFRWVQPNNSGAGFDSWALDDVVVEYSPQNVTYVWQPGFLLGDTVQVCPSQTTTYTVTASAGSFSSQAVVTVEVVQPPAPGAVTASPNPACPGDNVTLTYTGYQNTSEARFQWSRDGVNWNFVGCGPIAAQPNGSVTCQYPAIDEPLFFRAVAYNNPCAPVASAQTLADVQEPDRLFGNQSVCQGEDPVPLNLVPQSSGNCSVVRWESRNCAPSSLSNTWTTINFTGSSYDPGVLNDTTCFRAVVQCGNCPQTATNEVIVNVDSIPFADTATTSTPRVLDCSFTTGKIQLEGYWGDFIEEWEWSNSPNCDTDPDNSNWTPVPGSEKPEIVGDGQFVGESHRCYRAKIVHGDCDEVYSVPVRIPFDPCTEIPPEVKIPDTSFCCGGSLTLTPINPLPPGWQVERWEFSTNNGQTWTPLVDSANTLTHTPPCQTVNYRVWVSNYGNPIFGYYSDTNTVVIASDISFGGDFLTANDRYVYCQGECVDLQIRAFDQNGRVDSARFEIYDDAIFDWVPYDEFEISTNTATVNYQICNLDTSFSMRAYVNDNCTEEYSGFLVVTVEEPPLPGVLSRSHSVCVGDSSELMELKDYAGDIIQWERDMGCAGSWSVLSNVAGDSYKQANINQEVCFRVLVDNGTVCNSVYSNEIKVEPVFFQPSAGTLGSPQQICSGEIPDSLKLQFNTGPVKRWEFSYNAQQGPWIGVEDTNTYYIDSTIAQSTCYRAIAGFGQCDDTSNVVCIDVELATIAGRIIGFNGVCRDSCAALALTESNGAVETWQYRENCAGPWIDVPNNTTEFYTHCMASWADSACVRLILRSGQCARDTTDVFKVKVLGASAAGSILPANLSICRGDDAGTLRLQNYTGQIVRWEASFDCQNFGNPFTVLQADQDSFVVGANITQTTCYRVFVQNGTCPPVVSDTMRIDVDSPTIAGVVSADQTICPGDAINALTLAGHTGDVVEWQRSTDCPGFSTRTPINNQTPTLALAVPPPQTTCYRAVVQNGACPQETSDAATITLGASTQPGTLSGADTLCGPGAPAGFALSGHTGNIIRWESAPSSAPFAPVNAISHTSASYQPGTINATTCYRAVLGDAVCGEVFSNPVCAVIEPQTVPGAATAEKPSVCSGDVGGDVVLTGRVGDVLRWESSEDNFDTTTPLAETGDTLTVGSITVENLLPRHCSARKLRHARLRRSLHRRNAGAAFRRGLGGRNDLRRRARASAQLVGHGGPGRQMAVFRQRRVRRRAGYCQHEQYADCGQHNDAILPRGPARNRRRLPRSLFRACDRYRRR